MKAQSCYSGINEIFREKYIVRRVMEARESWTLCFFVSIPTINISTTVLNDIYDLCACVGICISYNVHVLLKTECSY